MQRSEIKTSGWWQWPLLRQLRNRMLGPGNEALRSRIEEAKLCDAFERRLEGLREEARQNIYVTRKDPH